MPKSVLAKITFVDDQGNPVDPDFGGGISGIHPGHDLPGGGHRPVDPGFGHRPPVDPGFGGGRPQRPSVWPPQHPAFPPDATDPEWGVDAGRPSHPIYIPIGGGNAGDHVDNTLPPVAGHKPPPDAPPGTVWPPLPPGAKPGKAALLFWLQGVGYRYVVVDLSTSVDNTLPGQPGHIDNALPGSPQPKK